MFFITITDSNPGNVILGNHGVSSEFDFLSISCVQFEKKLCYFQRYTHRVLQTIQMKLILLWVWAERALLGLAKTALKFKHEI